MSIAHAFEPAVGRYLRLDIAGTWHRLFVEQAGAGVPLVCLHTAGADSRQIRGLFNDAAILSRFRVVRGGEICSAMISTSYPDRTRCRPLRETITLHHSPGVFKGVSLLHTPNDNIHTA